MCSVFINGQAVVTAMAASLQGFKLSLQDEQRIPKNLFVVVI